MKKEGRAGRYIKQAGGFSAFIPTPLPPSPPVKYDQDLIGLLSEAQLVLGRLDGATSILPSPDFFVNLYSRLEAVLSSQIEGTQSTLEDVLEYEVDAKRPGLRKDVKETFNYFAAMHHGLSRLKDLPVSLRLMREIHGKLLDGVRGSDKTPGEFRQAQNWIGPEGCDSPATAIFVPPPPHELPSSLGDFEKFLHSRRSIPVLIHCGLAHAQFETIHPFMDGNGRVGRLLITFLLCWQSVLQRPLLYLSLYLKDRRTEYYERLMAVRNEGDWEGWLKFFLRGVVEVSQKATMTARDILDLRERHHALISSKLRRGTNGSVLLDGLFGHPVISVRAARERLDCSDPAARNLISRFVEMELLREVPGRKRNRLFIYQPLLDLLPDLQARPE